MASWLSAGSVDDGTVVRRASAAHTSLNFNAPDLFSPSKLESIFNKDENMPPEESNESLSFIPSPAKRAVKDLGLGDILKMPPEEYNEEVSDIPSPVKRAVKSMEDVLEDRAISRDCSSVKEAEQLSFIPSPIKTAGIKDLNDLTISNDPDAMKAWEERSFRVKSGPVEPLDELTLPLESSPPKPSTMNALDESTLPSDLSQGTSVAVKPKNRQSLGTGDYLSEASRVMTYLRQNQAAAQVASYEEQDPGNQSVSDLASADDWETDDEGIPGSGIARVAEKEPLPKMQSVSEPVPVAVKDTTVIRSPSRRVDWVEYATTRVAENEPLRNMRYMSDLIPVAAKDNTVLRSPEKHVDWVENALPDAHRDVYATPKYSILSLTPLPDFTAHEEDPQHPERSFVDQRAHERALRQAHGSLALSRDALIQAVTDAKPDELYWEEITELDLDGKGLGSLHGLDELCPNLVILNVAHNSLTHLNGVPPGVRELDVSHNLLSDMACWTGLRNLHILNISANKNITNLDGFGDLVHLRTLRAAACSIKNIDGVKVLDGLLDLQLPSNKLKAVDFGRTNFSQLESLNLACNKMESITNLSRLISLRDCQLSHNLLTEIVPAGRRGPDALETLEADNNLVDMFNLKQYPSLRYAMLDYNKLTRVHGLGKTPYFEELSIRNQDGPSDLINRILTTPNDCHTLILSGNPLPDGMLELPELAQHSVRALELSECGIKQLGKGFGRLFPNVRLLNLNYNHIQDITDLQGMHKIKRLELIRNHITRMRRTCLLLARLPTLAVLDVRDNPLTMAFHPAKGEDEEADAKWLRTCDENTKMRRRLTELLLAEHCKQLRQVNGLAFNRRKVLEKEEVWRKCEERGVLRRQ